MIIDVHCHIWSYPKVEYYKNLPVFDYLKELGIDKISLIGMNNRENKEISDIVKQYPDQFFGFAYVDPRNLPESLKALEDGVKAGVYKGVKMYPYFEQYQLDDKSLYPLYEKCLMLDIPLLFHVGWINIDVDASCGHKGKYACTGFPAQFGSILEDFPQLKLILAHLGGNYYYECLNMAERFENVYLETAWLQNYSERFLPKISIQEWIQHACGFLGSKKIIFGGEGVFPDDIRKTKLSEEQKMDILGRTAAQLLKL